MHTHLRGSIVLSVLGVSMAALAYVLEKAFYAP
jgi:hypothetical protein